jgi:hypothetical protein
MPVDARGYGLVPNASGIGQGVQGLISSQISKRLQQKALGGDDLAGTQLATRDPMASRQVGSILKSRHQSEQAEQERMQQVKAKQENVLARLARTVTNTNPELAATTLQSILPLLSRDPDLVELIPDVQEDIERFSSDPESVLNEYRAADQYFTDPQAFQRTTDERQRAALMDAVSSGLDDSGRLKPLKDLTAKEYSAAVALKMTPPPVGSAEQTMTNLGTADDVADTRETLSEAGARGAETGKLDVQKEMLPKVREAVLAVENASKVGAEDRSNSKALEVYQIGIDNIAKAMGQTKTGTFIGLLPAMSADAKTAEAALSVMAPVLKSVFRAAGEGTFTDKDQELLLGMLPKRTDPKETREAKLKMVNSIVDAKLGPVGQSSTQKQGGQIMVDANGNRAMVYPDGTFEEL